MTEQKPVVEKPRMDQYYRFYALLAELLQNTVHSKNINDIAVSQLV